MRTGGATYTVRTSSEGSALSDTSIAAARASPVARTQMSEGAAGVDAAAMADPGANLQTDRVQWISVR
jgi:hypothetical protein